MNPLDIRDSDVRLLEGPAGPIEVVFDVPKADAVGSVVITHPRPLLGGHALHKVPQLLAGALCELGYDTPDRIPHALVVHVGHDEQVPLQAVFDWARPASRSVVVVPGPDHFFTGRLHVLRALMASHFSG